VNDWIPDRPVFEWSFFRHFLGPVFEWSNLPKTWVRLFSLSHFFQRRRRSLIFANFDLNFIYFCLRLFFMYLYDRAWFWVLYLGFKWIRGYLVGLRARRLHTMYARFGRSLVFLCFINCSLFKNKLFLHLLKLYNLHKHDNMKTIHYARD
jgi:hypothetical protein